MHSPVVQQPTNGICGAGWNETNNEGRILAADEYHMSSHKGDREPLRVGQKDGHVCARLGSRWTAERDDSESIQYSAGPEPLRQDHCPQHHDEARGSRGDKKFQHVWVRLSQMFPAPENEGCRIYCGLVRVAKQDHHDRTDLLQIHQVPNNELRDSACLLQLFPEPKNAGSRAHLVIPVVAKEEGYDEDRCDPGWKWMTIQTQICEFSFWGDHFFKRVTELRMYSRIQEFIFSSLSCEWPPVGSQVLIAQPVSIWAGFHQFTILLLLRLRPLHSSP